MATYGADRLRKVKTHAYQIFDAAVLPYGTSGAPQSRNVGDRLGRKAAQFGVVVAQNLHHCSQTTQVGDRSTNQRVRRDLLQYLQRSDLCKNNERQ